MYSGRCGTLEDLKSNSFLFVFWLGSLGTACSNKNYCSPVLCIESEAKTPSPSVVDFYDSPAKDWAVCIFFVPVHTRGDILLKLSF